MNRDELAKIRNEVDDLYQAARREARIIATYEFQQVFDETDDPFEAMQAYNEVMKNLVGRS